MNRRGNDLLATASGRPRIQLSNRRPAGSLVAVCMATYNPDVEAFRRQIESIVNQSHADWICIINDDASNAERFGHIRAIVEGDPRFLLFRNDGNVGFYRNFEVCLRRVPAAADFVALADQDDCWFPRKLERCLAAFDDQTVLVYSDARIVHNDGTVVSDTYWTQLRPNHDDLAMLLLANTVTGAAAVFRASLLGKILPFPPAVGNAFHDHWIACVAALSGRIAYIDEPLYDYVQHGANVIGQCDTPPSDWRTRLVRAARVARACVRPRAFAELRQELLGMYVDDYRRLHAMTQILQSRFPDAAPVHERALRTFSDTWKTLPALAREAARAWWQDRTTDDREYRLALSYIMSRLDKAGSHRVGEGAAR